MDNNREEEVGEEMHRGELGSERRERCPGQVDNFEKCFELM